MPSLKAPTPRDIIELQLINVMVFGVVVAIAMITSSFEAVVSIIFGGIFSIANLAFLVKFSAVILTNEINVGLARVLTSLTFFLRFGLIAFVIFYLSSYGLIKFTPLILGFSIAVISIPMYYLFCYPYHLTRDKHERTN